MSDHGNDSESFDPRSWLGERGGTIGTAQPDRAPPAAGTDEQNFDPSSWGRSPRKASTDSTPDAIPARENVPLETRRSPVRLLGGAAAAVLAVSLSAAYLTRSPSAPAAPAAPAATTATAPAAPAPSGPGEGRRTVTISGPEQLETTLRDFGLAPEQAQALAAQTLPALGGEAGEIRLILDLRTVPGAPAEAMALEATRTTGAGIRLTAAPDGGFSAAALVARLTSKVMSASGEMDDDSFYTSAVTAGINDSLISDFANAFGFDVNFQTEVGPGDTFEAAFEQDTNPSGEAVGAPRLLFVSLRTKDKSLRYYRFTPPGESEASWFDSNGRGNKRSLMRTPVDGARITSNFGMRFHPVLHYNRLHGGTDFAAPVGTPIYAAADGSVVSASPSSCAGNMVILRHDNGWETRYFHSSRYADGITAGVRVKQGQTVSYVGNTGKCTTGPHLHYEVSVAGEKVDPMSIQTSSTYTLSGAAQQAFSRQRDKVDSARAGQPQ